MRDPYVRASEAEQVLGAPVFAEAYTEVERYFIEAAVSADANDNDTMIENIRHVRALRAVRAALTSFITTGKIKAQKDVNNVA